MSCQTGAIDLAAVEARVLGLVAAHRAAHGAPPLQRAPALDELARSHSRDMAAAGALSHAGARERVARAAESIPAAAGAFAENVAAVCGDAAGAAESALRRWLKSAPHRANLEGGYLHTGVGAARGAAGRVYITQIFAARS